MYVYRLRNAGEDGWRRMDEMDNWGCWVERVGVGAGGRRWGWRGKGG